MKTKLISLLFLFKTAFLTAQNQPITLHWLGQSTPFPLSSGLPSSAFKTGISWGVPFEKGKIKPNSAFVLKNKNGETLPLQTWTNAYWDDGSLKWLGLATVTTPQAGDYFNLSETTTPNLQSSTLTIKETAIGFLIKNGKTSCKIPKKGTISLYR